MIKRILNLLNIINKNFTIVYNKKYNFLYLLRYRVLYLCLNLVLKPFAFFIVNIFVIILVRIIFHTFIVAEELPVIGDFYYQNPDTGELSIPVLLKTEQGQQMGYRLYPIRVTEEEFEQIDLAKIHITYEHVSDPRPLNYNNTSLQKGNFFSNWLSNWWKHRWVDWWNQLKLFPDQIPRNIVIEENALLDIETMSSSLFQEFAKVFESDYEDEKQHILTQIEFVKNYLPSNFFEDTALENNSKASLLQSQLTKLLDLESSNDANHILIPLDVILSILKSGHTLNLNLDDHPELFVSMYRNTLTEIFLGHQQT